MPDETAICNFTTFIPSRIDYYYYKLIVFFFFTLVGYYNDSYKIIIISWIQRGEIRTIITPKSYIFIYIIL